MSDVPVFKRTKSKAKQRARVQEKDNEELDNAETESPSTLASKLKKKARAQPKSRLSFGAADEEDKEEVFQVKKSNLSRKIALGKGASVLPPNLDQATISPQSRPVYDAAYLSELKASTANARPQSVIDDAAMDVDTLVATDLAENTDAAIPSESSILAAKQKRDRLRSTTTTDTDYISLSVSKYDGLQGPHPESRLVREEDELGEGDDEFAEYTSAQERIALGKQSRKREAKKRKDEMKEMIADAEEVDDETLEWEQEQLRRGGHVEATSVNKPVKQTYKPSPIPPTTPIPTLAPAMARLSQTLTTLTISHADSSAAMAKLAEERIQLDTREAEMRGMITRAEAKRAWFAAFREWIESVATFLDEKFPLLEKLEDEHVSLLRERRELVGKRRATDEEDDMVLFLGALPMEAQQQEEIIDDLGRMVPEANPVAARRDRRAVRAARHARRQHHSAEEGFSTDSELERSDAMDFEEATEKLKQDGKEILEDVRAADFKDPAKGVGKWFAEWRKEYDDIYVGAWGGLGLVGAWEFWVRMEILGWDPLQDSRALDAFRWYSALYSYSRPGTTDDDDAEPELGPDGDLVSAMISTAVIPRLCTIVEGGALDPYSATHVKKVIDLAEQLEVSLEQDNHKFQLLLKAATAVYQQAVAGYEARLAPYLALVNPRFDPEAIPARNRLLARLSKLLHCILRWRKYTREKFGIGEAATRLVGECMLPVAETGWEVGGEERMRKVLVALPPELVPVALKARLGGVGLVA